MGKFAHHDPWTLRLDSVASPCTPQEAAGWLQRHATRLGLVLLGNINGEEFMAFPRCEQPTKLPRVADEGTEPAEGGRIGAT